MPNPGGGNQFGNFTLQPPYGDVKRMTELTREAPLSGSPMSGRALGEPQRAQRTASSRRQSVQQTHAMSTPIVAPPVQDYSEIAQVPGVSPVVRAIFGGS